jgi:DNA-binding MarR family transcriptional regulator
MPRTKKTRPTDAPSNEEQSMELDRIVHEPSRLRILAALNSMEEAGFKYLEDITKLPSGNLSTQTSKLEEAGYITIRKKFKGKFPESRYSITPAGKAAFASYKERMRALLQDHQDQSAYQQQSNNTFGTSPQTLPKTEPGVS